MTGVLTCALPISPTHPHPHTHTHQHSHPHPPTHPHTHTHTHTPTPTHPHSNTRGRTCLITHWLDLYIRNEAEPTTPGRPLVRWLHKQSTRSVTGGHPGHTRVLRAARDYCAPGPGAPVFCSPTRFSLTVFDLKSAAVQRSGSAASKPSNYHADTPMAKSALRVRCTRESPHAHMK